MDSSIHDTKFLPCHVFLLSFSLICQENCQTSSQQVTKQESNQGSYSFSVIKIDYTNFLHDK